MSNSAMGVLRQVGAGSVFGLGEEGRGLLLNQIGANGTDANDIGVVRPPDRTRCW